ncbi:MAG: dihydrolipoyl dehydrogenase [Peptococcaceae bacterium]|nr:dihydrolipoyl dehydrogenase [Peptococcaceae bacterium]
MDRYNVVVVGGGPGGYVAAIKAAQLGLKVALVEKEALGGTCLNWGCIPTKALVKSAEVWREMQRAAEYGLSAAGLSFDYARVMERKNAVVTTLVKGIEQLVKSNKVTLYRGSGEIVEAGKVTVRTSEKLEVLATDNIIIATGSSPAHPPIPGSDLPGVMTSDDALAQTKLPERVIIIGGGIIGLEFASIYNSFGSKVSVVEMLPTILPPVDEEMVRRVGPLFKRAGMEILTKTAVKGIAREGSELAVTVEDANGPKVLLGEQVLIATGRRPALTGVDWQALGLKLERGAIVVNDKLETGIPGIYAVGDAIGGIMLAHVASAEGVVAAENCAGVQSTIDYRVVPSCIFTYPELAGVGMTEQEVKTATIPYKVSKFPFSANGKALAMGETLGTVKLIAHATSGVLLGAHIMGPGATDLVHELALAVKQGLSGEDIAHTIHAHPTLSEAVMEAAEGLSGKAIHLA